MFRITGTPGSGSVWPLEGWLVMARSRNCCRRCLQAADSRVRMTMSWTEERIDTLKKMWDKGLTATQIAEERGGVSRNAVIGKAHRLGLQSRPSPVKQNEAKA